jgi:hypothetical protein
MIRTKAWGEGFDAWRCISNETLKHKASPHRLIGQGDGCHPCPQLRVLEGRRSGHGGSENRVPTPDRSAGRNPKLTRSTAINPTQLEGRGKDDGTKCRVEGRATGAKSLLCPVLNSTQSHNFPARTQKLLVSQDVFGDIRDCEGCGEGGS